MKLSAFALGLILVAGTALAQKQDSSEKTGSASEIKTQSFKGTLVNAACGGSASNTSSSAQASADREKPSAQPAGSTGKGDAAKGDANRASNGGSSCNISSSSGEFALQTKDGRTLRFDAVGNERVKQELLNRKNWTNASAAGKPIQATVNGAQTGDSLMVLSIH